MKILGILLILVGLAGIGMGSMMFGDIGIACMVGAASALLSGFSVLVIASKLKKIA